LLRFNIPAGHLTARSGPKDITAIAYAGAGLPFLLLSVVIGTIGATIQTPRTALIARFGVGKERVRIRAYTRKLFLASLLCGDGYPMSCRRW
jgi:hypothetical protein